MTTDGAASTRDKTISRYSALARTALQGGAIIDCDPDAIDNGCFGAAAYTDASGAPELALHASLGCGNPVAVADLRPGETVLDMGSGGGLDVLLSARRVSPAGIAYGLDGSPEMLALARANAAKAGVANVRFLHGHIEDIPLPGAHVDVVISNCVVNLSADKPRVLAEAFQAAKPANRMSLAWRARRKRPVGYEEKYAFQGRADRIRGPFRRRSGWFARAAEWSTPGAVRRGARAPVLPPVRRS
jgi:SAM-dependent methyltransferase